jgi:hypothetical protein
MLTLRNVACATILVGCLAAEVSAQDPEIALGRLTVSVGMAQAEVAHRAESARQRLSVLSDNDRTAVVWENEVADKSNRSLGSIVFENARVKVVFKNWTSERAEKDIDVGNALFALADSFVRASNTLCALSTTTTSEPGQQDQRVTLRCGRRSIEISTVRNDQYRILSTSVSESIR